MTFNNPSRSAAQPMFKPLDKLTYVRQAEKIIKDDLYRDRDGRIMLTTNQIRVLLDLINDVYMQVKTKKDERLSDDIQSKIQYCKMKIAYQAGKDTKGSVKDFVAKTNIMNYLDAVNGSRDNLILVAHYMEALVAYHKFYA